MTDSQHGADSDSQYGAGSAHGEGGSASEPRPAEQRPDDDRSATYRPTGDSDASPSSGAPTYGSPAAGGQYGQSSYGWGEQQPGAHESGRPSGQYGSTQPGQYGSSYGSYSPQASGQSADTSQFPQGSTYGQGSYGQSAYGQPGSYGQTAPFGQNPQSGQNSSYGQQPSYGAAPAYYPGAQQTAQAPKRSGSRAGLVVAVVALCALSGGIGGVVGASVDNNSSSSSLSNTSLGGDRDTSQPVAAPAGSTQAVAAKVLPSVVSIDVRVGNREGEGSGVVLSSDGVILTNNHVVTAETGGTGQLTVSYSDGTTSGARVLGTDPISDIAVIKADKTGLTPIVVGTSGNLAVGQSVIAVGSPLGLAGTVTTGIISSLNRPVSTQGQDDSTASVIDAIQTDAAINPGNSGGALVNANGALIGINSAIASLSDSSSGASAQSGSIGLGFAIPIDQAIRIAKELEQTGKASQAGLGVSVRSTGGSAQTPGAQISDVTAGGAAARAGIPSGALVTKVNDRVIGSGDALVAAIRSHAPGDTVSVTFTAGGATKTVQVTLDTLNTGGN